MLKNGRGVGSADAYASTQDYLVSLKAQGPKFGIDRMRLLAAALGHPERAVPCLHVAGTNGKGSVAAMLASILQDAGWRTGLYTSPHLVRLGERVQVNRRLLGEAEIVAHTRELRPVAERLAAAGGPDDHPSFFEFMTAMAFHQFVRDQCDLAVIETGLGGRLDATNIVTPLVSVITSIGLDHCELLGGTVEEIAAEKGGIIKPGVPVVLGRMPAAAEAVLRRIAGERGAPVHGVREEFGGATGDYPATNLEGDYQRWNAATATLAARALPVRWRPAGTVIARGLQSTSWPGRWERTILGGRTLVLDASHNPEGAAVLDANLTRLRAETGRAPVVMMGALGAARARPLLEVICRHAREVHLLVPQQARASGHAELEALLPADFRGPVFRAWVADLFPDERTCAAGGPGDVLVVTGSIYLLGEIMERLDPGRGPGEGRLQDF